MPNVSGTKRKWYMAVTANCSRDRSTSDSFTVFSSRRWHLRQAKAGTLRHRGGVDGDALPSNKDKPQGGEEYQLDGEHHPEMAHEPGGSHQNGAAQGAAHRPYGAGPPGQCRAAAANSKEIAMKRISVTAHPASCMVASSKNVCCCVT